MRLSEESKEIIQEIKEDLTEMSERNITVDELIDVLNALYLIHKDEVKHVDGAILLGDRPII
jgi:leucyl-tRNA synthetase